MTYAVVYSPEAAADLQSLLDHIADRSGAMRGRRYVDRIMKYCDGMTAFPQRGRKRDDLRPGLRVIGFERRVAIAFHLTRSEIIIDRVFYGGRDLDAAFAT